MGCGGVGIPAAAAFRTPGFYVGPDLDHKQIRTEVEVNSSPGTLVMDDDDFLSEVAEAPGNGRLYTKSGGQPGRRSAEPNRLSPLIDPNSPPDRASSATAAVSSMKRV